MSAATRNTWNKRDNCRADTPHHSRRRIVMAKKGSNAVYRVTDVIGTSSQSWEDAARSAVKTASKSLRDLRIAEVTKLDVKVEDGRVVQFRTRLSLSFKYDA